MSDSRKTGDGSLSHVKDQAEAADIGSETENRPLSYGYVVVHVPHASVDIPQAYRESILLGEKQLWREIRRMTDAFCDELYSSPDFPVSVIAKHSRFVCDVERFRDDLHEPRAKFGQGLMYTRTVFGKRLRAGNEELRDKILYEVYDPHHKRLTEAVESALEKYGKCLIIDGHSFPSSTVVKPLGIFTRPDFDIGTDEYHTPDELRDALCKKARELGYSVKVNTPFSGAITPMKHYKKDKRVTAIMLETNRRLYMNSSDMTKTAGFEKTREACLSLMRCAAGLVAENR